MSYICGGNAATSRNTGGMPADLRTSSTRPHTAAHGDTRRVVPDLYRARGRRLVDFLAARAIAAALYLPVLWAYRGERRKAGAR